MLTIHRKNQAAAAFIPDFTAPLGLLVHCHLKIEAQLGVLERATQLLREGDPGAAPAALDAVKSAQAHFAGPGVKHTADASLPLAQLGTSRATSNEHCRGSSMRPSRNPSTASHCCSARSATSASLSADTCVSANARWFQIAPIVKPV